jgi:IclR family KDG regulon transcriptional repressor
VTHRSIKSAERTLRLFELFSRAQDRLTVSQVARGLAMPQPSTTNLLMNLAAMGYLEYDRTARSYAPTVRIALLGGWLGPHLKGSGSLALSLDELHDKVNVDTYVGIQNGAHAQAVLVRNRDHHDLSIDSGQMYSLTRSAVGQALLAIKPDSEVVRIVRRCNAEAESGMRVNEPAFLTLMGEVRRRGYAMTDGFEAEGRVGIAVAIRPSGGFMSFAVGVGGPADVVQAKRDIILHELCAIQAAALASEGPGGFAGRTPAVADEAHARVDARGSEARRRATNQHVPSALSFGRQRPQGSLQTVDAGG